MAQQFTPWQKMQAYETTVRKLENNWRIRHRKKHGVGGTSIQEGEEVIFAEPIPNDTRPLTYYNNGKTNACGKTPYDYNFGHCEGYDQFKHRDDRKHTFRYLHIYLEEAYPCRSVPVLVNSNYGHRPPIDPLCPIPKVHAVRTFYRSRGTDHCINANGYRNVKLSPTTSFQWNAEYGYTYAPRN